MKKHIFSIIFSLFSLCAFAQIDVRTQIKGINIQRPSLPVKSGYFIGTKADGKPDWFKVDSIITYNQSNALGVKVIAGTNTTVTGAGTQASPFVVNAAAGGTVTADNGLTKIGSNIQLGGTLLVNTIVDGTTTKSLQLKDLSTFDANVSVGAAYGKVSINSTRDVAIETSEGYKVTAATDGVYVANLPAKTTETEVVYRNSTTGKLAVGTIPASTAFNTYHAGFGFFVTANGAVGDVVVTKPAAGEYTVTMPAGIEVRKVVFNGNCTDDGKIISGSPGVDVTFNKFNSDNSQYVGGATGGDGDYYAMPNIGCWDFNAPAIFGALNSSSPGAYNDTATTHYLIANPSQGVMTFRSLNLPENYKLVYTF